MLQISNLSFSYQNQPLFENLNLILTDSEIVGIIGDNGVGKTTLLRLIAGELKQDDGSIRVLGAVGFLKQTQDDMEEKSGGERTQIRLAELFRQDPDIMLPDEPTNNLDGESKAWLLRKLHEYHGLALVVSHDRDFLEKVADKIVYLHGGRVEVYLGNYASFCEQQAQARHEQWQSYERSKRVKKKLERQLKDASDRAHKSNCRNYNKISDESKLRYNGQRMAAQNSAGKVLHAAQSRIAQIATIEKPVERKTYSMEVSASFLHERKLLEVVNLSKSYGKKKLFEGLNFEIHTGECIRICGRNGSGKSTLFQIILGKREADSGEIWIAPNIEVGYVSQDITEIDPNKSLLEQSENFNKTEVFRAAATLDFLPQDMYKPISKLSRGQLTKVSILRLILQPLDLVIIDELTNHIDIRTRENIESALNKYPGAMLIATHDEAFAQAIKAHQEVHLNMV